MKLPRNVQIWARGYIQERVSRIVASRPRPERVWLTIADHFEPMWRGADMATAAARVALWRRKWPEVVSRIGADSAGNAAQYTFFYAEEQYRQDFLDQLADLSHRGIADVEVHIHHHGDGRQNFADRITGFCHTLHHQHQLLRKCDGKLVFGFIHGNWALDNSLPGGRWCGLNGEAKLLRDLGCYADFTMPSGDSESQSRIVNQIYWCTGDPTRPKSYDTGRRVVVGALAHNNLLIIPGPLGLRWTGRLMPRMETGELAANDLPTRYRAKRWLDLASHIGSDVFIKLYTHGAQEKNSSPLLGGALQTAFEVVREEAEKVHSSVFFATAWQMYVAVEAIRQGRDPVAEVGRSCNAP